MFIKLSLQKSFQPPRISHKLPSSLLAHRQQHRENAVDRFVHLQKRRHVERGENQRQTDRLLGRVQHKTERFLVLAGQFVPRNGVDCLLQLLFLWWLQGL